MFPVEHGSRKAPGGRVLALAEVGEMGVVGGKGRETLLVVVANGPVWKH